MSVISTGGARIDRWDNGRPARQRQKMPLIEAIKLHSSLVYPCSEASITFISKRHNGSVPFLRPTGPAGSFIVLCGAETEFSNETWKPDDDEKSGAVNHPRGKHLVHDRG
jgi:hypothetical protein